VPDREQPIRHLGFSALSLPAARRQEMMWLVGNCREGRPVEFILLDWTRMGRQYCLAGAVVQAGQYRIVRPLPARSKDSPFPNQGWSAFLMDGHARWEVFVLERPEPARAVAPHLEDTWVHSLKPSRRHATRDERRAVLQATLTPAGKAIFGSALTHGYSGSFTEPGTGERSLASLVLPSSEVQFTALWRDGSEQPDVRVSLPLPEAGRRILPVKDHFLLSRAEKESSDIDEQLKCLAATVRSMGSEIVVRLGLSRPFASSAGQPGKCWLMADGFFSLDDPQS
jgi:hypothetical protein